MTELFEEYYGNKLSASERLDFKQKLKSDTSFAQDYDAYIMMMEHMESKDDINSALNNLNDVHLELDTNKPKPGFSIFKLLIITLLISIFGYTLYYVYSTTKTKESEPREILATYFKPAPISLATKGIDNERLLAQINLDYNANKHIKVIDALNQVNIDSIGENRLYLMLGSSYIANGFYEQSRDALKPLESFTQFKNDFYWYTAMSYLGENNVREAKFYLLKIPVSSNYSSKVKLILSKIE